MINFRAGVWSGRAYPGGVFGSVGWGEMVVLLVAALVILGPERLPGAVQWTTQVVVGLVYLIREGLSLTELERMPTEASERP